MAGAALFCIHFLRGQSRTEGSPHSPAPASGPGVEVEVDVDVDARSTAPPWVVAPLSHPTASAHAGQAHTQSRIAPELYAKLPSSVLRFAANGAFARRA